MAKKKVEVSLKDEVTNVGQAMAKTVRAVFEGNPGLAASIKGKRKSAQFTFKVNSSKDKTTIQQAMREKLMEKAFKEQGVKLEAMIRTALENVVRGLAGVGDSNVKVGSANLGRARPDTDIEDEPFARFIKSKTGAGEIGLPDPDESLRNLKIALVSAITVDVVVRGNGPQVKFNFDQTRLLKRTPHPNQFESGAPSPFFSWLSLVTGPQFAGGGTPGYSLVRASEIRRAASRSTSGNSRGTSGRNTRRVAIAEGLIRVSRTRSNAGEMAAIMMRTASARAFGGDGREYRPSSRFEGFWDKWWIGSKGTLEVWTRRIMRSAIRQVLRG